VATTFNFIASAKIGEWIPFSDGTLGLSVWECQGSLNPVIVTAGKTFFWLPHYH